VAPALAARLDMPFHDRLTHGPETRGAEAILERLTEEDRAVTPPGRWASAFSHASSGLGIPVLDGQDLNPREEIRRRVVGNVSRIAAAGGGVILGRGAAVVLAGEQCAFHVRLDGPRERRIHQGMALEGVDEAAARTHQADTDKSWSQFVQRVFDRDPSDPRLYHLMIDSTVLAVADCVDVIARAALAFWGRSACG
jgi:cytidylate kinase